MYRILLILLQIFKDFVWRMRDYFTYIFPLWTLIAIDGVHQGSFFPNTDVLFDKNAQAKKQQEPLELFFI